MSVAGQVAMSGAIGGTAEVLGGGKFANGAVTGAYVMMFNHMQSQQRERAKQELQSKLNMAAEKSRMHYIEKGYLSEAAPFWINFELEGWTPGNTSSQNIFNSIELTISIDGIEKSLIVDVYMTTAANPTNEIYNYGYKFVSQQDNRFALPRGFNHNLTILNRVEYRYGATQSIVFISFKNANELNLFHNYVNAIR